MTDTLEMMQKLQAMFGGTVTLVEDESSASTLQPVMTDAQYFAASATFCAALHEWHARVCLQSDPFDTSWCEQMAKLARRDFHVRLDCGRTHGARFVMDQFADQYGLSELEMETVLYLHFCERWSASAWPREHELAELAVIMTPGYSPEQRQALVTITREDAPLRRNGLLTGRGGMARLNPAIHAQLTALAAARRLEPVAVAA